MASWSTVTIAKEKPEHVKAFVAWHLGAGADEVMLYYDKPEGAVSDFDHLPQVKLVLCDRAFWALQDQRVKTRGDRQVHCATLGYQAAKTDWLLHCDIDEFMFGDNISELLDAVPSTIISAQVLPLERVFLSDENDQNYSETFRKATEARFPKWLSEIYNHPFQMVKGLRGHHNGKVFARTQLNDVIFRAHNIEIAGISQNKQEFRVTIPELQLLHFYTFGFDHFRSKGQWKFKRAPGRQERDAKIVDPTQTDKRRIETAQAVEAGDDVKLHAIFEDSFVFTPERLARLAKHQDITTVDFINTLKARLDKYFP